MFAMITQNTVTDENGVETQLQSVSQMGQLSDLFPNTSFPPSGPNQEWMDLHGIARVVNYLPYDSATQKLVTAQSPTVVGNVVSLVDVVLLSAGELKAARVSQLNQAAKMLEDEVQTHMDSSAKSMGYDNLMSAISYVGDNDPLFSAQGQAFKNWRSVCWKFCFDYEADVVSGLKSLPTRDELIAQLPELVLS